MKFKTFSQLHAERAARRARPKKKNKKKNKSTSPQAGGPAHKESGLKPPSFPDSCNNLFDREVE
jgi:hypothetical protein